jgi:hypothetical protein
MFSGPISLFWGSKIVVFRAKKGDIGLKMDLDFNDFRLILDT